MTHPPPPPTDHGNPMFVHRRDVVLVTANYRLGALGWMGGAAVARQNAGVH